MHNLKPTHVQDTAKMPSEASFSSGMIFWPEKSCRDCEATLMSSSAVVDDSATIHHGITIIQGPPCHPLNDGVTMVFHVSTMDYHHEACLRTILWATIGLLYHLFNIHCFEVVSYWVLIRL